MFLFLLCVFGFFVFAELVSIVPEFSSYCKPCGRNSVCLTSTFGTDEISEDAMVGGQCHVYRC
jgi:hypothetical protein